MMNTTLSPPEISLVIFDCDGVLVDSEMLSATVLMRLLADAGVPIDFPIFRTEFLGRSFASAMERTYERTGIRLPDDFQLRYRSELLHEFGGRLRKMENVDEVLEAMRVPFCVATSSSPQRLNESLRLTGLAKWFSSRLFTASMVDHGKPAPDLFLHTASQMGFQPGSCLVIEDSEMGVRAAKAAGMTVWHFAGGSHVKAGYCLPDELVPNRVVGSMKELRIAFSEIGIC